MIYDIPLAKMGQTLWYEILPGMVIPVKVLEISDVYSATEEMQKKFNLTSSTIWDYLYEDGSHNYVGYIEPTSDNQWGFNGLPKEVLEGATHVNQFVWIDEPVGHAVQIDDEVYLTLEKALLHAMKAKKRWRSRAHKKVNTERQKMLDFINSTRIRAGAEPCPERIWPAKKIYVKR